MSWYLSRWSYLSQVIVQRVTLVSILSLAVAGALWSLAAAVGLAPGFGWTWPWRLPADAGPAVQLAPTLLLFGLCFFSR